MNIEIANRLVELRKQRGLSQEDLAQELGISRQAVSKWERAESSPDTDNLILLARLYGVSLDDMLKTDEEIPMPEEPKEEQKEEENTESFDEDKTDKGHVHIGWDGIHVKDGDEQVDISWNGIHVKSKKKDEVKLDGDGIHVKSGDKESFKATRDGVYVNGKYKGKHWKWDEDLEDMIHDEVEGSIFCDDDDDYEFNHKFYPRTFLDYIPYGVIVFLVFLYLGVFEGMWHPAWILLFTIPIYSSFAKTVRRRNLYCFNYSMLAFTFFLYVGFTYGAWHPGWVIFVTIPVYYYLVHYFKRLFKKKKVKEDPNVIDIEVTTNENSKDEEQD
ncbi:helix-turn-helix transcriptional regulator [Anaerorhabdus furcosa]|uniref:Transcriptional regulator, contains XRE-family HTH domain n=1 Tax=Anaerorhabdus furcosa TaxID=118967 RepID=A0A1T4PRY2_9FIRM|nr:helix-turn-helix transcriptional regulator [Anaerorhabdus furcosa]SJZ94189.1 Transcriptional regulator, contains XRE-family HTH domain [Anaerorhabdus furcosa]